MLKRKATRLSKVRFLVFGCLILGGILLSSSHLTQADDFLKFHWKFDEGSGTAAGDASGNTPSYPGTLYGGPAWMPGGGLTFDGVNDYTRTNSAIPGSMGVSDQAYTLSASVRVAPGELNGNIIHISNGANGIGWCISMLHIKDGKFRAIGWDEVTHDGEVLATAPTAANTNEWYSIANTWSPQTKQLQLFINGQLAASTAMDNFTAANQNVYVFAGFSPAGMCNNTQGWFKGDVKDVRIYNRAITQEEAEENSNESLGIPPLSATAPIDSSTINQWNPAVNWGDADECAFSYNNADWTTLDCTDGGSDVPPPDDDGNNLSLYLRSKYTDEELYATDEVSFTYDTTSPVVDAGSDLYAGEAPLVHSSPTASDATSGIASYAWTKQSGPGTVTFSNSAVLDPTISAVSQDGTYVLRLTVTDEAGNTAYSEVTLTWDATNTDVDANGDGIADNTQSNVTSFTSTTTGKKVVLEVEDSCEIEEAVIKAEQTHMVQDIRFNYPQGLFNFTVDCGTPGFTADIKQYYYGVDATNAILRKYNPNTKTYFDISGAALVNTAIYDEPVAVASYSITDGGELDTDATEDGIIVDPAGLGVTQATDVVAGLADTGEPVQVFTLVAVSLISMSGVIFLRTKLHRKTYN